MIFSLKRKEKEGKVARANRFDCHTSETRSGLVTVTIRVYALKTKQKREKNKTKQSGVNIRVQSQDWVPTVLQLASALKKKSFTTNCPVIYNY